MPTAGNIAQLERDHASYRRFAGELEMLSRHLNGRPGPSAYRALDRALEVVDEYLSAHIADEERTVYPIIESRLGSDGPARALRADHRRMAVLAGDVHRTRGGLEHPDAGQVESMCSALHELSSLLGAHMRREEAALGAALMAQPRTDAR